MRRIEVLFYALMLGIIAVVPPAAQADESNFPAKEEDLHNTSRNILPSDSSKLSEPKPEETLEHIASTKLEKEAKKLEKEDPRQNQPDYSLIVYPQERWRPPQSKQIGWQSYYIRVKFLLRGGLSHNMSDVASLSIDGYEAAQGGDRAEREATLLQALNAIFTDEGTTGKARTSQNGLTNVLLTPEGNIYVKRSSLCAYNMPLAHFTTNKELMKAIYLPDIQLPARCGDVPTGVELDIIQGPHEELLQRLYCDDFPHASYCSPNAEHWTISEFKR